MEMTITSSSRVHVTAIWDMTSDSATLQLVQQTHKSTKSKPQMIDQSIGGKGLLFRVGTSQD